MGRKKQDLRIIKTEKSIKQVFSQLIQEKPLEKITVTEIASRAEINKGTFYLHYSDIYALYDVYLSDAVEEAADTIDFYTEFFESPESFIHKFMLHWSDTTPLEKISALIPNQSSQRIPQLISDAFRNRLYATSIIHPSIENDMKLDFILCSLAGLIIKYGNEYPETIQKIVAQIIRSYFPVS